MSTDDPPRVQPDTREDWRAWLEMNHTTATSAWLVTWKKHTGNPTVSYEDAVSEALAFGWVDSKGSKLDEDRTMLYFARRKPGSGWSRPNKVRIAAMRSAGLMTPAGEALIAAAEADGSWTMLDDVENLTVPTDLAQAFSTHTGSFERWETFPRSARRGILEWIVRAKTPVTRAKRAQEAAEKAALGERANQWNPKRKE